MYNSQHGLEWTLVTGSIFEVEGFWEKNFLESEQFPCIVLEDRELCLFLSPCGVTGPSKALDPCFLCEWINECPSELETNSQHQQYPAGKPGFPDSTLPLQPLARVELLVSELPTWFWPTALFDLPVHCDSGWLFSGLLTASSIWR